MRNSFATAVPVTGTPLPAHVRAALHEQVRFGATITGVVDFGDGDFNVLTVRRASVLVPVYGPEVES